MKWISIEKELPPKNTIFWALITGRDEPSMVSGRIYIPDYCIILLQMMNNDGHEARTMDMAEAIYLAKEDHRHDTFVTGRSNCRAHGHFTHWMPFNEMPLPEKPE